MDPYETPARRLHDWYLRLLDRFDRKANQPGLERKAAKINQQAFYHGFFASGFTFVNPWAPGPRLFMTFPATMPEEERTRLFNEEEKRRFGPRDEAS